MNDMVLGNDSFFQRISIFVSVDVLLLLVIYANHAIQNKSLRPFLPYFTGIFYPCYRFHIVDMSRMPE